MSLATSTFGRYTALFKVKGVVPVLLAMTVARMPTGCIAILLILFVNGEFGPAIAGITTAGWTIGTAVFAPFYGRLVDRGWGIITLRLTALAEAAAVVLLIVSVVDGAVALLVVLSALLCGALTPPYAGTIRALWQTLVSEELLPVAYSFEILLIDVLFVSGPLVASVFIALDIPLVGICLVMGCLVVGSIALSCLDSVRLYAHRGIQHHATDIRKVGFLLRLPAVDLLLAACLTAMAFSGWLEALLPLYYSSIGQSMQSGIAIAVWSVGSIIGVLLFVRLQPSKKKVDLIRQLLWCTAAYLVTTVIVPFCSGIFAICVALFFVGLLVSPCTNLHYQLGGDLAPRAQHAEMFSWINTATSAGISLGTFLAGTSVELLGPAVSFQLPVLFVVLSLLFTVALGLWRRFLQSHSSGARPTTPPA